MILLAQEKEAARKENLLLARSSRILLFWSIHSMQQKSTVTRHRQHWPRKNTISFFAPINYWVKDISHWRRQREVEQNKWSSLIFGLENSMWMIFRVWATIQLEISPPGGLCEPTLRNSGTSWRAFTTLCSSELSFFNIIALVSVLSGIQQNNSHNMTISFLIFLPMRCRVHQEGARATNDPLLFILP